MMWPLVLVKIQKNKIYYSYGYDTYDCSSCCSRKNIAFVGLIIPQIVRKILGEDYRKIFLVHFYLSSAFNLCDIAARMLFNPYETPIGVFTAL